MPSTVDPKQLSPTAAAHFEANVFADRHPEFFLCRQNSEVMMDYIKRNNLSQTVDDFEQAYKHLREEGKILIPSRETMARLTAEEAREIAFHNGIPHVENGVITGYAFPEPFNHLPPVETEASPYRLSKNQMAHPEDFGRVPSKAEFAMWGPDRTTEWLKANGHHGHELPKSLR